MQDAVPDAGGGGALDLLSSSFLGAGFPTGLPPISGGDAGPSNAVASSGGSDIIFNNPFSVAGQGGTASASASPNVSNKDNNSMLLGLAALAAVMIIKRS